jgi:hypothetical protein
MAKRSNQIAGAFIARPRQLVDSPVMAVLSQAAFRALNRIESEHMAHGGAENGKLPVTYAQFEDAGLHSNAIAPALRELEALGIIETTRKGYGGAATMRAPSTYRLTYVSAWNAGRADGTGSHDYLKFSTVADAEAAAKKARSEINGKVAARAKNYSATLTFRRNSPSVRAKTQFPALENRGYCLTLEIRGYLLYLARYSLRLMAMDRSRSASGPMTRRHSR